jgi:UDP-N-acetyl-D-mannosaminuronic acid dehydrogenase
VACVMARAGFNVTGIELRAERVACINAGQSPIEGDEPGLEVLLAEVVARGQLRATTDYAVLDQADVVLINVETPVGEDHQPQYVALRAACKSLGAVLQTGALVVVESTIAPGTMDQLVRPILEETTGRRVNEGFYLVTCPERVMPGKLLRNLAGMSRVIGASSPQAAELAVALYRHFVQADLDVADCITAEIVKTAENAYRDVQIAFANEVALICEVAGADVWQVRELVNKSPYRQMHLPGAGVGGHCIPKDPWLLAYGTLGRAPIRLIPAARAVNEGMPTHVGALVLDALREAGLTPTQAQVVILGYAYLENSDDARNTPTEPLMRFLQEAGVRFTIHDPFVPPYETPLEQAVAGADCLVLMVRHHQYLESDLAALGNRMRTRILVDGRNAFTPPEGFIYRGLGRASVESLKGSRP